MGVGGTQDAASLYMLSSRGLVRCVICQPCTRVGDEIICCLFHHGLSKHLSQTKHSQAKQERGKECLRMLTGVHRLMNSHAHTQTLPLTHTHTYTNTFQPDTDIDINIQSSSRIRHKPSLFSAQVSGFVCEKVHEGVCVCVYRKGQGPS